MRNFTNITEILQYTCEEGIILLTEQKIEKLRHKRVKQINQVHKESLLQTQFHNLQSVSFP